MILKPLSAKPMPINIFINLNVVLDVVLERPGYQASLAVLQKGEVGDYKLHLSAHAVTTFAYLLEQAKLPPTEIKRQINWLLRAFVIVSVDVGLLQAATDSKLTDYEDAVVEQAALACKAETIITRNI